MTYELPITALITSVFSLIGLYLLYTLQTRKMKLEQRYKINRFKLGNKYKLKQQEMPQNTDTSNLTDKAIRGLIDRFINTDEDTEQEEDTGLTGIIRDVIENNPELVKQYAPELIKRFLPQNKEDSQKFL